MKYTLRSTAYRSTAQVLALIMLLFSASQSRGQVSITGYTPVTQNFDGIGGTATATLPSGFKIGPAASSTYATANGATTVVYGTSGTGVVTGTSGGGAVNWANGIAASATDRCVGWMTSGSYASPTYLYMAITNNTGAPIVGFSVAYDYELYRTGQSSLTMSFQGSNDGTNFTSIGGTGGTQAYSASGANTVVNPTTTISKSFSVSNISIAVGATYYFRWVYTGSASSNGIGIGVDNISITAVPPTHYYSASTGNLDANTTWGLNTNGTGANPANFSTNGSVFHISNGNGGAIATNPWTVTDGRIIADGTDVTITSTKAISGVMSVYAGRTVTLQNTTLPTFDSLNATSTLALDNGASNSLTNLIFGNLSILGSSSATLSPVSGTSVTLNGSINVATGATGTLTMGANTVRIGGDFTWGPSTNRLSSATTLLQFIGTGAQAYSSNVTGGHTFSSTTLANTGSGLTINNNLTTGAYVWTSGTLTATPGTSTTVGSVFSVTGVFSGTATNKTFLGGGTWNGTSGNNGGVLRLNGASGTATGGITVGTTTGSNSSGILDWGVLTAIAGGNSITINSYSQLNLTASGTIANSSTTTLYLNGPGNGATGSGYGTGALRTSATATTWSGVINLASDATINNGGTFTTGANIAGSGKLTKDGSGTLTLITAPKTWTGGTIINGGSITIANASSLGASSSSSDLTFAQKGSGVTTGITFSNSQTIGNLSSTFDAPTAAVTQLLSLAASQTITITQSTNGTFGNGANATQQSRINGAATTTVVKAGSADLTLTSGNHTSFLGRYIVNSGNLILSPSASTTLIVGPITVNGGALKLTPAAGNTTLTFGTANLNGGAISTVGIGTPVTSIILTGGALTLTENSTITLDATTSHQLKFGTSASSVWTAGKKLTIYGWQGPIDGTSAGTTGRVFIGTSGTSTVNISATNLGNINFVDGLGNTYLATQIANGEVIPKLPTITTGTITPGGPYSNVVDNTIDVPYTYTGPVTGTVTAQLSDASGSFASATTIGSAAVGVGGTGTITAAVIPSVTAGGTGYKIRVVATTPLAVTGSESAAFTITSPDITINTILPAGPYYNDINNNVVVDYSYTGPITGSLTAQLSDAGGTFTSPTTIGTGSIGTPTIACLIPLGTNTGAYKIRIVAASPFTINGTPSSTFNILAHPPVVTSLSAYTGVLPGATLTLNGTGFNLIPGKMKVHFGPAVAIPTASTFTTITVTVPVGATLDNVTVTDTVSHLSSKSPYQFIPDYINDYFLGSNPFSLQAPQTFTGLANNPWNFAVGDLDGDGKPDIAVVKSGSSVDIYRNTANVGGGEDISTASFQFSVNLVVQGSAATGIKIADFDGDGRPDIAVAGGGGAASISILRNTTSSYGPTPGSISFQANAPISIAPTRSPKTLAIADFDGDGKLDIAASCYGTATSVGFSNDTLVILRNQTTAGVAFTGTSFGVSFFQGGVNLGSTGSSIAAADYDGDGQIDIAAIDQIYDANPANLYSSITIFENTSTAGSMAFSAVGTLSSAGNYPTDIATADMDRDGIPDLVLADQLGNAVKIYHNTGSFGFSAPYTLPSTFTLSSGSPAWPGALGLADIDGDGKVDIVGTNTGNAFAPVNKGEEAMSIYRNTNTTSGVLSFSSATPNRFTSAITSVPGGVLVADLDLDKYSDIIIANNVGNSFSIYRSKPQLNTGSITGASTVCHSSSTTLSYSTAGIANPAGTTPAYADNPLPADLSYVWSSTSLSAGTIDPVTGVFNAFGSDTVSAVYTLSVTGTNLSATVLKPINITFVNVTLGASPASCSGDTAGALAYTLPVGSPNSFSIAYGATALGAGFTNVSNSSLPGTIPLVIPPAAPADAYTASLTVSDGTCVSDPQDFIINISASPTATIITSDTAPCAGRASDIQFAGTFGADVDYTIDGLPQTGNMSDGTLTLSFPHVTVAHTYVLTRAYDGSCATNYHDTVSINPILMQWVGGASGFETDWNTAANWACGIVPTDSDYVTIPVTVNRPEILTSSTGVTYDLNIVSGATLTLNSLSVLNIKGDLNSDGTIIGAGMATLNGTTAQTLTGTSAVSNMKLDNSNGATIASGSRLTIKNALTVNAGTLTTNDSLELYSDVDGSARIAEIPASGAAISGKVKVNQYIQSNYRRYRFWSHPFSDTISLGQLQAYMDITGTGGSTNGFTTTVTNAPSAFRFDPITSNSTASYDPGWKPITKINGTEADSNKLKPYQGIRLFMRGTKGQGLNGLPYVPSANTMAMRGAVNQGDQNITLLRGSDTTKEFNLIGNPYPSPVDLGPLMYAAQQSNDITGGFYYVYYATGGSAGLYQAIPISSSSHYSVGTNAAYQVRADHNGAVLHFTENMKTSAATTYLFKSEIDQFCSLYVYDANYHPWDMLYVKFSNEATDAEDRKMDGVKPMNSDFNMYSISADNKRLIGDCRPFVAGKTIPMGISSPYQQEYIIKAENIVLPEGGALFLHDKLLAKYVELNAGTEYRFNITSDKASQGDRFELSMKPAATQVAPQGFSVAMSPNPATDDVKITFTTAAKEEVAVRIMDMSGVTIYQQSLGAKQSGTITVPMAKFATGIYMVELTAGDHKSVQKLVKE